ncbi:MAG: putative transporter, rane protein [Betaproteobacteria bacterium]|nr:putative transporter, rane protein [Betaproteobacteria bacterium]
MNKASFMSGAGSSTGQPAWGAVFAMALCVAVLIASEFMPVSLLTPIARDLGLTEGQAGQAISISGVFAVITSLSIATLAGRMDRRFTLIGMSALLIVSGGMVALAPNFLLLMVGRALLGVAIGGFWSMSAATVMRLVPEESVPRGLAIIYGGNAIAATISAPLGSFLGGLIGWRGAFLLVVPLAVAALIWQCLTLPSLPARKKTQAGSILSLLRNRQVALGMGAVMLLFMGQFALYTYLRPFLESVTGVSVPMLSILLLIIGVAGVIGTSVVGEVLKTRLQSTLVVIPVVMAVVAVALAVFGNSVGVTGGLLAIWGLVSTAAPVAWSTWLTRTLPEDAEAGGGLMVAIIQLAITAGATVGGLIYDASGPVFEFGTSAAVLGLAAVLAFISSRASQRLRDIHDFDSQSHARSAG